jgi:hypothetical protein
VQHVDKLRRPLLSLRFLRVQVAGHLLRVAVEQAAELLLRLPLVLMVQVRVALLAADYCTAVANCI